MSIITSVQQITPAWLTALLRETSDLARGDVVSVDVTTMETSISVVAHLTLTYSDAAASAAPRRLFAKLSKPDLPYPEYVAFAGREVRFYREIAPTMTNPALVRCYAAAYDPDGYRSHLILDDLSDTHTQMRFPDEWPLPPFQPALEQMIASFARFHAAWWNHPRLEAAVGAVPAPGTPPSATRRGMESYGPFVDFLGDRLSSDARALYEQVLAAYSDLARRIHAHNQWTLTHGDAHFGNVLVPKDVTREHVRIIDWDVWQIDLGVNDLAELLAQPWYAGPKAQREQALVHQYYDQLVQHGVSGYTWEDCWEAYRFAVISQLFVPLQQWADQQWPGFWWSRVERSIHTFDELGCAELLK